MPPDLAAAAADWSWLSDPADRVELLPRHEPGCAALEGGDCNCTPMVELVNIAELVVVREGER